jgi:hypothetical protein
MIRKSGFPSRQTQMRCAEILLRRQTKAQYRFNKGPSHLSSARGWPAALALVRELPAPARALAQWAQAPRPQPARLRPSFCDRRRRRTEREVGSRDHDRRSTSPAHRRSQQPARPLRDARPFASNDFRSPTKPRLTFPVVVPLRTSMARGGEGSEQINPQRSGSIALVGVGRSVICWPNRLPTSSTTARAVRPRSSRKGLSSTMSTDCTNPESCSNSMIRCASR